MSLIQERNDLSAKSETVKSQIVESGKDLSAMEQQLKELGSRLANELTQVKHRDAEIEKIKTLLDDEKREKESLQQKVKETEAEVVKSKDKYENLTKDLEKAKETVEKIKDDVETRIATDKDKYWNEKLNEELQSQKKRYEAKVKDIHDTLTTKYKAKIEECIKKWQADVDEKDKKFSTERQNLETRLQELKEQSHKFEERYNLAKRKLEEVVNKMEEVSTECTKKDGETNQMKKSITLLEVKVTELESKPPSDKLSQENLVLQQEIKKLRMESRSLQVQFDAADAKIRELQKGSKSTSSLPRPKVVVPEPENEGFKMPSMVKNTPGRTRASRTQSEVSMPRRPPQGSGAIFMMDEEAGEMFSSSYLSDLKAGRCSIDNGRISELARRNTMQPAHLQSSYPAETQFRPAFEFTDDELRFGKIQQLTDATANLSVDSPALNTRRQSSIRLSIRGRKPQAESSPASINSRRASSIRVQGTPPQPQTSTAIKPPKPVMFEISPQVRTRKRQSMTKATDLENSDLIVKRSRKELSYSKPGPPTPARRHNRSNNSSLNTSAKSLASNQSILTTGSNVSIVSENNIFPKLIEKRFEFSRIIFYLRKVLCRSKLFQKCMH